MLTSQSDCLAAGSLSHDGHCPPPHSPQLSLFPSRHQPRHPRSPGKACTWNQQGWSNSPTALFEQVQCVIIRWKCKPTSLGNTHKLSNTQKLSNTKKYKKGSFTISGSSSLNCFHSLHHPSSIIGQIQIQIQLQTQKCPTPSPPNHYWSNADRIEIRRSHLLPVSLLIISSKHKIWIFMTIDAISQGFASQTICLEISMHKSIYWRECHFSWYHNFLKKISTPKKMDSYDTFFAKISSPFNEVQSLRWLVLTLQS